MIARRRNAGAHHNEKGEQPRFSALIESRPGMACGGLGGYNHQSFDSPGGLDHPWMADGMVSGVADGQGLPRFRQQIGLHGGGRMKEVL